MREKELQLGRETLKLLIYSDSEIQRRHFCGTFKRIENRRTCFYRLRYT